MKSSVLTAAVALFLSNISAAQPVNAVTETVKIYGNCGMCETAIEKAGNKKSVAIVDWNKDSKMAVVTFNSKKTNLGAILKNIALAGYDNQEFLASDAAYNTLPECCKYEREKKTAVKVLPEEPSLPQINHQDHQEAAAIATPAQANPFQAIYNSYFSLKDALVKTDATGAAAKAATLVAALDAVKMETLKPAEHTVWMNELKDLKTAAKQIAGSTTIEKQRAAFAALSSHVYALAKASAPAEKIYYQNCPMYNDGKGANWLSKESGIKNPYYGAMMLNCGKTVEEIQ